MGIQARIVIPQISIRNVVVLISQVKGGATIGCEQLHTPTKLSREVEMSFAEHPMVEIKETSAAREKWFDAPKVHEIHLRTDRTSTKARGIYSVPLPSTRIANHQLFTHPYRSPSRLTEGDTSS